ncbi:MAG: nucleotide exchange factor GrpE [Chloroflexota bacterium]|nr:nucleotide exchange factor GrpE [Chloroflexota bacterium]
MTRNRQKDQQVQSDDPEVTQPEDVVDNETDAEELEEEVDELAQAIAERDNYLDQLQRSVAEFTNYRRRSDQERSNLVPMIRRDVLAQFIPVIDDFERALGQLSEDDRNNGWVAGFAMINTKLQGVLERSGVLEVNPLHEPFDPSQQEAVATEPGTGGSTVVEVYQKGYRIGDVLIRPAMVKTGDPVETSADERIGADPTSSFDA